jgi:hypothetical protein
MKTITILRHSDKVGEHISQAGLEKLAGLAAKSDEFTDLFCGSDIGRTAETALAAVVYGNVKPERLHPVNVGLGNKDLFQRLIDAGFMAARKDTGDNLVAARVCLGDGYEAFCEELAASVSAMIDEIPDGGIGLVFGHSPLIEMAAEKFGQRAEKELDSCEGFTFTV